MNRLFSSAPIALALSLAACGGSHAEESPPATETSSGDEHGHHEHAGLTPELDALHEVLAPVWHSEPGTTRATAACAQAPTFATRAHDVQTAAAPAEVDAAAWTAGATQLVSTSAALSAECDASGAEVEARFSEFHDAFHVLMEQSMHEGHDEAHEEAPSDH